MENEMWAVMLGGVGSILKIGLEEWQARNSHRRDVELTKLEMKAAPIYAGSSGGVEVVETAFDRVLGKTRVPGWVTALRGSMRSTLSILTLGGLMYGFVRLLMLSASRALSPVEAQVFVEFAGTLEFLVVLAFTFFFGTRMARR